LYFVDIFEIRLFRVFYGLEAVNFLKSRLFVLLG